MTPMFFFGAALAAGLVILASALSLHRVKRTEDFAVGGGAGIPATMGSLIGVMVGGASTVGTAELAFTYGFSAWWFTIGSALTVVLLALLHSGKYIRAGISTVSGIIGREYGERARKLTAILNGLGNIVNLLAQIFSGAAVAALLFPKMSGLGQVMVVAALMMLYIIFGGMKSMAASGIVKALLVFPAMLLCGAIALKTEGGFGNMRAALPADTYFNLLARGAKTEIGSLLSMVMGALTSQAYLQVIMAAKNERVAKKTLLLGSVPEIVLGAAGVLVGLSMRMQASPAVLADPAATALAAKTALPAFIEAHFPPFVTGLLLCVLLITVVGCGAAIAFGAASVLERDILPEKLHRASFPGGELAFSRCLLAGLLLLTALSTQLFGGYILDLSFISLGLRAVSTLAPLEGALLLPGRIDGRFVLWGVGAGLAATVLFKLLGTGFNPAVAGTFVSFAGTALGYRRRKEI